MRRLALLVSFLALASAASAQGLDAAARKERERREKNRQAGVKARVVSDQDVRSGGSAQEAAASSPASKEGAGAGPPAADLSALDAPASGGPTATSDAQSKAERWRARYRPAKERVTALEKEIPELTDKASRIGAIIHFVGPGVPPKNPNIRTEAEAVVQRLAQARAELISAKQTLQSIEEGARKDGVPSGQLY